VVLYHDNGPCKILEHKICSNELHFEKRQFLSRYFEPVVHSHYFPVTYFAESKVNDHPRTGHESPEGKYLYSPTLSLTLALDGVGGQGHASTAVLPGKTRNPLYRRLAGPQRRAGRVRKISPPP